MLRDRVRARLISQSVNYNKLYIGRLLSMNGGLPHLAISVFIHLVPRYNKKDMHFHNLKRWLYDVNVMTFILNILSYL